MEPRRMLHLLYFSEVFNNLDKKSIITSKDVKDPVSFPLSIAHPKSKPQQQQKKRILLPEEGFTTGGCCIQGYGT
jgi:hypothetical protein